MAHFNFKTFHQQNNLFRCFSQTLQINRRSISKLFLITNTFRGKSSLQFSRFFFLSFWLCSMYGQALAIIYRIEVAQTCKLSIIVFIMRIFHFYSGSGTSALNSRVSRSSANETVNVYQFTKHIFNYAKSQNGFLPHKNIVFFTQDNRVWKQRRKHTC